MVAIYQHTYCQGCKLHKSSFYISRISGMHTYIHNTCIAINGILIPSVGCTDDDVKDVYLFAVKNGIHSNSNKPYKVAMCLCFTACSLC